MENVSLKSSRVTQCPGTEFLIQEEEGATPTPVKVGVPHSMNQLRA